MKRAQGIRTAADAAALGRNDVTMQGTYWFDLRTRTPIGARVKRVLDVTIAALLLVLASPLMLILAAAGGLLVERRVGFRGNEFNAYTFRVRSLGWLPQLINVLNGSMSLVGPRALERQEARHVNARRFSVQPGLTGLWHVQNGDEADADRTYVNDWSVGLDLRILALTVLRW
jgi:exopolysaccharide production protein ExoY